MSRKTWYLKQCKLFERLGTDDIVTVEVASRIREFPKGSPIYLPAERAESVMLLAGGRVKICNVTEDGKQAILAFIEPGELFGELAILAPGEREEYAEAAEKSTVVLIPGHVLDQLIERNPQLAMGVTKLIGLRRRRIERRLKSLLFRSNRERLVHLLLELAGDYGRTAPEGLELAIKLSHQELASVIGSTRETVTVLLGELQAEGQVRLGRRKIVLTDLKRLAESIHAKEPSSIGDSLADRGLRTSSPARALFPKP